MKAKCRKSLAERFWKKVSKTPTCWLWTGAKGRAGHGQLGVGRRNEGKVLAHRLSYQLHVGQIPGGMCVLHRCDVGACVNPEHLFLGTKADNSADMSAKGRSTRGEKNPRAKLTELDVKYIRYWLNHGATRWALAKEFDIQPNVISRIKHRQRWAHVP